MNLNEYLKESARTESPLYQAENVKPETVHAAIGLVTEAGELLQSIFITYALRATSLSRTAATNLALSARSRGLRDSSVSTTSNML